MEDKKPIIVFNGIHASGKSTIARELAVQLGYDYYPEIGAQERANTNYNQLATFRTYDYEILAKEAARDREILQNHRVPIIETWHIGNLAYIKNRSSQILALGEGVLTNALKHFDPLAVFLDISWDTFRQRAQVGITPHDMDGLIHFYEDIKTATFELYKRFNINHFIVRNDGSLDETLAEVKRELATYNHIIREGNHSARERI